MGIASATHNQLFIVSMFAVSAVWSAQVLRNFKHAVEFDMSILDTMLLDHEAILQATRERDRTGAEVSMRAHITHVSM